MTPREQYFPDTTGLMHVRTHRDGTACLRPVLSSCQTESQHRRPTMRRWLWAPDSILPRPRPHLGKCVYVKEGIGIIPSAPHLSPVSCLGTESLASVLCCETSLSLERSKRLYLGHMGCDFSPQRPCHAVVYLSILGIK